MEISIKQNFIYRLSGETENELYQKFNTCKENVLRNNPNIPLYKGEIVEITINDYLTHYVKPTETLNSIANKYGVQKQDIIETNNLQDERLFIGQRVKIYTNKST